MRIGIDVDLTIAKSDELWWKWLCSMCGGKYKHYSLENILLQEGDVLDYNLSKYFPEPINKGVSVYDFWRSTDLYAMVEPVSGAIETITRLKEMGHEIIFISTIKGHTNKSKWQWLDRYFPFDKGYIATKDKHYIDVDVMIDDRAKILNSFSDKVKKVMYNTPYIQDEFVKDGIIVCNTWMDIAYVLGTID